MHKIKNSISGAETLTVGELISFLKKIDSSTPVFMTYESVYNVLTENAMSIKDNTPYCDGPALIFDAEDW